MDLEEALKRYAILIPSDSEFYSEEYKRYFEGKTENGEFEKYRPFQEMFLKSFCTTFYNSNKSGMSVSDSKAVVLGGQTGAGKSALVHVAKNEFKEQGREVFLIDDDMYRMFYPKAREILEVCPEHYIRITAIGSGPVTPKIMRYASEKGLNFIFDGTLKNPRIIETAMGWQGYDINWKVMATSKIESLLSIFERNEELRRIGQGRLITVDAHNETYTGLGPTLMQLESMQDMGRIQVYSRGESAFDPVLQYDSMVPGEYSSAFMALEETRRKEARKLRGDGLEERIARLKNTPIPLNDGELEALSQLEKSIMTEIEER